VGKKLFVGGLSWNTSEAGLRRAFESAGDVESVTIVMDRETGKSRGFGFVAFSDDDAAARAVDLLNETSLDGRSIRVDLAEEKAGSRPSRPSSPRPAAEPGSFRKLFIGGLSYSVSSSELHGIFSDCGTCTANVIMDRETGQSRGFAFVTFENAMDATLAVERLDGIDLGGRKIQVRPAEEKSQNAGAPTRRPESKFDEVVVESRPKSRTPEPAEARQRPPELDFVERSANGPVKPRWTDDALPAGQRGPKRRGPSQDR
jgi:nucleolin